MIAARQSLNHVATRSRMTLNVLRTAIKARYAHTVAQNEHKNQLGTKVVLPSDTPSQCLYTMKRLGGEDAALKRLHALMRLPLQFKQGDEYLTPARLTSETEDVSLVQVYRDRQPELRMYFEKFYKLWSEKRLISMSLLQGSPGMGSSAFMDVLANMTTSQVRAMCPTEAPDEFCRWIAESIHVSIDLTLFQHVKDIKSDNIERILAVLTLHRYFAPAMAFVEFLSIIDSVPELRQLELRDAFEMLSAHRNKMLNKPVASVFLNVDEFDSLIRQVSLQLDDEKKHAPISKAGIHNIVTQACRKSSNACQFNPILLATLDKAVEPVPVSKVVFFRLSLIDGHASFNGHPLYQRHIPVRRMVAELNGHPRSLNVFRHVLQTNDVICKFDQCTDEEHKFRVLFNAMVQSGKAGKPLNDVNVMDKLVVMCLLSKTAHFDGPVLENSPNSATYSAVALDGNCAFHLVDRRQFKYSDIENTIAMSPFVLRQFIESNKSKLDPRVIQLVKDVLNITGTSQAHGCGDSESFHTLFEVLRAALHGNKRVNLGSLYCAAKVSSLFEPRPVFTPETEIKFQAQTDLAPFPRSQYSVACSVPDSSFDFLILPTNDFPMHITEIQPPRHQFSSSEILRRRAIIENSYAHYSDRDWPGNLKLLIVVSMSPQPIDARDVPHSTLVLDRNATLWMYGPTFSAFATWFDIERKLVHLNAGLAVDDKTLTPTL